LKLNPWRERSERPGKFLPRKNAQNAKKKEARMQVKGLVRNAAVPAVAGQTPTAGTAAFRTPAQPALAFGRPVADSQSVGGADKEICHGDS
jgi:hypothetical protein